jgi:hypothetical protein
VIINVNDGLADVKYDPPLPILPYLPNVLSFKKVRVDTLGREACSIEAPHYDNHATPR